MDTPGFNSKNAHEAFEAIYAEAVRLKSFLDDKKIDEIDSGLDLIISLSRYRGDIRSAHDMLT